MCEVVLVKFPVAESLNPLTMAIRTSTVFCSFENTRFLCSEMLKVNLEYMKKILSLKVGIATLDVKALSSLAGGFSYLKNTS